MQLPEKDIARILLEQDYLLKKDLDRAQTKALKGKTSLSEALFSLGLVTKEIFGEAIAEHFHVSYADLKNEGIDEEVLHNVPELVARAHGVIAFGRSEDGVKLGMVNPKNVEAKYLLEKRFDDTIIPYFISEEDFSDAIEWYKPSLKEEFQELLEKLNDESLSKEGRDELTVEVVDMLLQYGYKNKASDIHIEPYAKKMVIRFRIDGVMHDVLEIPKELIEVVLTRIKILSRMRTDEHRDAQDGKLRFVTDAGKVDVRVSVVPVTHGENVVLRLLSAKNRRFDLKTLGFGDEDFARVRKAVKNPHGMILVTGPTGSGKSTSLYAMLKILNKRDVHISTIEDPVEYDVEGVSQIQVNNKTGLTFAKGLRAIVRQDPDIIMVGEIRDEETAGISVNSALTGHLVLSTLHTNDAATTLPRLLDMSVEPFLVASTVRVIIAQRLVRTICQQCRVSYTMTDEEKKIVEREVRLKEMLEKHQKGKKIAIRLYKGNGCKVCGDTGYLGRIGVFEVLEMGDEIKDLILNNASSDKIAETALAGGMTSMLEDGIKKVLSGKTTLQEVLRVTRT